MSKDVIPVNPEPPMGYAICDSENCPRRESCLRSIAAVEQLQREETVRLVNRRYPSFREGEGCRHYRSSKPERYAYGFAGAMERLSVRDYREVSLELKARTSQSTFYRMKSGELALSPEMQRRIIALFRKHGYQEEEGKDFFARYEYRLTW